MPPVGLLRLPGVLLHIPPGFEPGFYVVDHVVLLCLVLLLYLRTCLRHLQRVGRMPVPVDIP